MIPAPLRLLPSGRVCACGRACERGGVCGWACMAARVCAISRVRGRGRGRACSRGPLSCVVTSVIDVHTTTVCEHVNSLLSLERYSCVVNLGLFLFFFQCFFFFSFFFVRWGIFFFWSLSLPASFL